MIGAEPVDKGLPSPPGSKAAIAPATEVLAIGCVIVHPNPIFREGLTSILAKSQFNLLGSASTTKDLPSTLVGVGKQLLVLMGVHDRGTLDEVLSAAEVRYPDAHMVVFGDPGKRDLVTTALAAGATSFVDENVTTSSLIKQLELIAQGEPVISVLILKRLLANGPAHPSAETAPTLEKHKSQPPHTEETEPNPQLSDREATILNALVRGTSNKAIANKLNITEATVKVHVKSLLRKIQVKNRTQAAIWALHHQASPKSAHEGNRQATFTGT